MTKNKIVSYSKQNQNRFVRFYTMRKFRLKDTSTI